MPALEAAELDKRVALKAKYDAWQPKFSAVQSISVERLCALMEKSGTHPHGKVVLVDVRLQEEYQVDRYPAPMLYGSKCRCCCCPSCSPVADLPAGGAGVNDSGRLHDDQLRV